MAGNIVAQAVAESIKKHAENNVKVTDNMINSRDTQKVSRSEVSDNIELMELNQQTANFNESIETSTDTQQNTSKDIFEPLLNLNEMEITSKETSSDEILTTIEGKYNGYDVTVVINKEKDTTTVRYTKDGQTVAVEFKGEKIDFNNITKAIVQTGDEINTTYVVPANKKVYSDITHIGNIEDYCNQDGPKTYLDDNGIETEEVTEEWVTTGKYKGNDALITHHKDGSVTVKYTNNYEHIYEYDSEGNLVSKDIYMKKKHAKTTYNEDGSVESYSYEYDDFGDPSRRIGNTKDAINNYRQSIRGRETSSQNSQDQEESIIEGLSTESAHNEHVRQQTQEKTAQQESIIEGLSTESAHNEHVRQQTQEKTAQQENISQGLSTESAHNEHVRQQTQNNAAPQTGYTSGNQNSTSGTPTGSPADTGAAVSPQPGYTPGNQNSTPGTPTGSPAETGAAATQ